MLNQNKHSYQGDRRGRPLKVILTMKFEYIIFPLMDSE